LIVGVDAREYELDEFLGGERAFSHRGLEVAMVAVRVETVPVGASGRNRGRDE